MSGNNTRIYGAPLMLSWSWLVVCMVASGHFTSYETIDQPKASLYLPFSWSKDLGHDTYPFVSYRSAILR